LHSGTFMNLLNDPAINKRISPIPVLSESKFHGNPMKKEILHKVFEELLDIYNTATLPKKIPCKIFNPGTCWKDKTKLDKDENTREAQYTTPFNVTLQFAVQYVPVSDQ